MFPGVGREFRKLKAISILSSRLRSSPFLSSFCTINNVGFKAHDINLRELRDITTVEACGLMISEQLPERFSRRLDAFKSLPNVDEIPELRRVRKVYEDSLRNLKQDDPTDTKVYARTLQDIKQKHASVAPKLILGLKALRSAGQMDDASINHFLQQFFDARVSTEILSSHYLALYAEKSSHGNGILDPQCDPARVVNMASVDASSVCSAHLLGLSPNVKVNVIGHGKILCIPQFLYYVMFEVLKNSLKATVDFHVMNYSKTLLPIDSDTIMQALRMESKASERVESLVKNVVLPDVEVTIVHGADTLSIRVSDKGGGINIDDLVNIFDFTYSTTGSDAYKIRILQQQQHTDPDRHKNLQQTAGPAGMIFKFDPTTSIPDSGTSLTTSHSLPPLSGFGCGLPLAALYTRRLCGTLKLFSMPSYGTDAYITIRKP